MADPCVLTVIPHCDLLKFNISQLSIVEIRDLKKIHDSKFQRGKVKSDIK